MGREPELRRFRATLASAPAIPANIRLTGLRGVGKTVLLSEYENAAADEGWLAVQAELRPGHNNEQALAGVITQLCSDAQRRASLAAAVRQQVGKALTHAKNLKVSYGDFELGYSSPSDDDGMVAALAKHLYETAESAVRNNYSGFVILLDEAQTLRDDTSEEGEHPLSLLLSTVASLQKAEVPIGLVLGGLPTLSSHLLKARSYSERMFRAEHIGSLPAEEARRAFEGPLLDNDALYEDGLVSEVVAEVDGYPYFLQLWGYELWNAAAHAGLDELTTEVLQATRSEIYRRLDLEFYEPRVSTLTPAEQDLLLLTAGCHYPPIIVSEVQGKSSKRPGNTNVLLGRLVESGVLYRLRKGEYDYTAPRFHEYLQRRKSREPGDSQRPLF